CRATGPFALLFLELRASLFRERVVFGAAVVLSRPPFGIDEATSLEPLEGEHERARIHLEHALADLLDALGDSESVHWLKAQALEDEHVQRSLDDVSRLFGHWGVLLETKMAMVILDVKMGADELALQRPNSVG